MDCPSCDMELDEQRKLQFRVTLDGTDGGEDETQTQEQESDETTFVCPECGYTEKR